jgi:N-acetylglutamate synthase-like GNAT family acetyltransferase
MIIKAPESTDEWNKYFHLRWQVLRAPWSQPLGSERDESDFLNTSFHAIALINDHEVIGVSRIHLLENNMAQIRYMAISENYQGQGVGASLIDYLENIANKHGVTKIILQAREGALNFYLKEGYSIKEKTFLMYHQIQHFLMEKEI